MSLSFDATFYQTHRPDVYNAFIATAGSTGLTWAEFAQQHYNTFGRFEGSDPSASFDTSFYLSQYPDVAAAGINPFDHFLANGSLEMRLPFATFPASTFVAADYAAANTDLAAAGITTDAQLYQHWVIHGQFEGRSGAPTVETPGSGTGVATTLTTAQDIVTDSGGDDTVSGVASGAIGTSTLQVSDSISLGAGTDTVNITDTSGGAQNLGAGTLPTLSGADIINITSVGGAVTTLDTTFAPDATQFWSVSPAAAGDGVTFNNLAWTGQQIGINGDRVGTTVTVNTASGDTNADDALTVNLIGNTGTGVGTIDINGSAAAAGNGGFETVNLVTSGSASIVGNLDSDDSLGANRLTNVNVTGDQNLTIGGGTAVTLLSGGTFNSSAATGAINATINGAAGALTISGGAGGNTFILDAIAATDTIDAGSGTSDTIGINGNTAVASGGLGGTTNAENFALAGTSTATQDVDNIGSFASYIISSTGAAASFIDLADGANTSITSNATGATVLELKTNGVADTLNLSLDNGAAGTAQTIANLAIDANGTGTVETLNVALGSTGGVTLTANALTARDIVVTGGDAFTLGTALEAVTTNFNASAATGVITVSANAASTTASSIRTGTGNDAVTLQGGAGGDVTVDAGAGNDNVNIAAAQEHVVTLGDGSDNLNVNDLATAGAGAVSTLTEQVTVQDFATGSDKINLSKAQFAGAGLPAAGNALDAAHYFEGTLASTAGTTVQLEALASAAGIAAGQAYIASIEIAGSTYVFYDSDGHAAAGNVSNVAILNGTDLTGIALGDFAMIV
ncbi:beta strand repeat-containing protein [Roseibium sp.]|uniref:beta strand repeat-containing protein n=1 Tax=Roseibium sp. TaxID=1936156 RepID=UPI003B5221F8